MQRRDQRGIIGVWGWGTWTPHYAEQHFRELAREVEQVRTAGEPVRVLVNLRKAAAQPPATIDVIRAATDAIYRPGDRMALLVGSSLLKTQMSAVLDRSKLNFFLSDTAATIWLTPDQPWQQTQLRRPA